MAESDGQSSEMRKVEKTRIVLADGSLLFRQGLRVLIEKQQDLEVVAEAGDGKEVVQVTAKLRPDIVLMDVDLPMMDGFQAARKITEKYPSTKVLLLSQHWREENVIRMEDVGAGGYLPKTVPVEVITHAIRAIAAGEVMRPPPAPARVNNDTIVEASDQSSAIIKSSELTTREMAILKLVGRGLSNKDIALRLDLSVRYVKASLSTIFMKLHVSSRTEAVSYALKTGILTLNDING